MQIKQYVVMSKSGFGPNKPAAATAALHRVQALGVHPNAKRGLNILDSRDENSMKLLAMTAPQARALAKRETDLLVAPVLYYQQPKPPIPRLRGPAILALAGSLSAVNVQIVDASTQAPIAGVEVLAFQDFDQRVGARGKTGSNGKTKLALAANTTLEVLAVIPPLAGYWGVCLRDVVLTNNLVVPMQAIDPNVDDAIDFFHRAMEGDGSGVKVGVIDTGCGPHPHLVVSGDADNGDGHGSHCAGIIAGRGKRPTGKPGIAPAAQITSYRVFPKNGVAANYTVAQAIEQAVDDGCDLLNLSLGFPDILPGEFDAVIRMAINAAFDAGTLVFVAAGNDYRGPVGYPATEKRAIAVSAVGREQSFPADSFAALDIDKPRGNPDRLSFAASFTNVGAKIAFAGAGAGIVSTVPGGYGMMSGTSMATPAIVGMAAKLLSTKPAILNAPRNAARAKALLDLLQKKAKKLGIGKTFEGFGVVR